mmetsp:Transcript_15316/g.38976  ORF Transcript_15316/g.38976 Transcript_15316/m.38976 type:complete len:251 (+) Transcript_15316:579-1331(+)
MSSLGGRPSFERETNEAHYLPTGQKRDWRNRPPPGKKRDPPPTHFLALPLNHSRELHAAFERVHKNLVTHNPILDEALVEAASAHITLGVLTLASDEQVERVSRLLTRWRKSPNHVSDIKLSLSGLGHFNSKVLYVNGLDESPSKVLSMQRCISQLLFDEGLLGAVPDKPFVPHCTIAKVSKMKTKRRGKGGQRHSVAKIDRKAYEALLDLDVGVVEVPCLQLCTMRGRQKGEYYNVISSVSLRTDPNEV